MLRTLFGTRARPGRPAPAPRARLAVGLLDDRCLPSAVLINEVVVNPPTSTDSPNEYIEIRGTPGDSLNGVSVVVFEGELPGTGTPPADPGTADMVIDLNGLTLGSNGLLIIKGSNATWPVASGTTFVNDSRFDSPAIPALENGSASFVTVRNNSGTGATQIAEGTDYDADDDGTLEALPGGATGVTLEDGVGYAADAGDLVYGFEINPSAGTPDAMTRVFTNADAFFLTPSVSPDWYGGDLVEDPDEDGNGIAYDPAKATSNLPADAVITRGDVNFEAT